MGKLQKLSVKKLYFKDTSFASLMKHRIYNVLLISNKYDAFILEEDGRIEEQLFNEYYALNLRYPPRFTIVDTLDDAVAFLKKQPFELVIVMSDNEGNDLVDISYNIKKKFPKIPLVVLTHFLHDISQRLEIEKLEFIDYIFCWLGNFDLFLAIIKLVEDKINIEEDIASVGVQMILFVEDLIQDFSSILPYIYNFVFIQSRSFMTEALNEHQQMLRMRGRPKILLARNYEEAISIYQKYRNNILGVISDMDFPKEGKLDKNAGVKLYKAIKSNSPFIPYLLESSDRSNKTKADALEVAFINKSNKNYIDLLKTLMLDHFGFGDFLFRNPKTWEIVARAANLNELQKIIYNLPDDTLAYHVSHNHVSHWLYSRALFPLASYLESITIDDFRNLDEMRDAIMDAIVQYRKIKNRGVVAEFRHDRFDKYSNFARIGSGSMGGKGRGLAFLDNIIKNNPDFDEFKEEENVFISVPKTVILCTDIFEKFMEINNLDPAILSEATDQQILNRFLEAKLQDELHTDFTAFLNAVNSSVAIRSSSLLEDSYQQPFAGVYSTYMIPYDTDSGRMVEMLENAIKAVYASVFYKESRAYMASTANMIDSEKMAIILQEVVGKEHGGKRYYPDFSGVLRSVNFYPLRPEKPEDGICNIALGLGKYVVDGNMSLRFSPVYPQKILQTSQVDTALRETQTFFYAIDITANNKFLPALNDVENLLRCDLHTAEEDGSLRYIGSTFDPNDGMIRDGIYESGRRLVTFSNILKHEVFPLSRILKALMKAGQKAMGHPVEIEFAVNMRNSSQENSAFYLLQIRPIVTYKESYSEDFSEIAEEDILIESNRSLGCGTIKNIYDVVYVKPEDFKPVNNLKIAEEIGALNQKLLREKRSYILIGPGRWGSGDPWLGIPVRWSQISAARVIVEAGLANYCIDPSQGTHFFHNITSLQVAYLTIRPYDDDGDYELEFLNSMKAEHESTFIRHVSFDSPLVVKINGKTGKAIVFKTKNNPRQKEDSCGVSKYKLNI